MVHNRFSTYNPDSDLAELEAVQLQTAAISKTGARHFYSFFLHCHPGYADYTKKSGTRHFYSFFLHLPLLSPGPCLLKNPVHITSIAFLSFSPGCQPGHADYT